MFITRGPAPNRRTAVLFATVLVFASALWSSAGAPRASAQGACGDGAAVSSCSRPISLGLGSNPLGGNPLGGNPLGGNPLGGNPLTGGTGCMAGQLCAPSIATTCGSAPGSFGNQGCSYAGYVTCSNGALVSGGQSCPFTGTSSITSCANGQVVAAGGRCPVVLPNSTATSCPGAASVPVGQPCPAQLVNCPNGQIVTTGQQCAPIATTTTTPLVTCPDGEILPPGQACPAAVPVSAPPPGLAVSYATGWNLIGGPTGTTPTGALSPLYTFQPGDTAYEMVPAGSQLRAGAGYWAYFPSATTASVPLTNGPQTNTVSLPAGQFVMIGNPGNSTATVSGADTVFVYDPTSTSYMPTVQLAPGQGAWAVSLGGGQATITTSPS